MLKAAEWHYVEWTVQPKDLLILGDDGVGIRQLDE